jgi:hypothetical protein
VEEKESAVSRREEKLIVGEDILTWAKNLISWCVVSACNRSSRDSPAVAFQLKLQ